MTDFTHGSITRARAVLATAVVVAAVTGPVTVAGCTRVLVTPATAGGGASGTATPNADPGGSATGFSSPSLAQSIARRAGSALAGQAPQVVSLARTLALSNEVPAGASVDRPANRVSFTGRLVSFTVVAVPPGGPDMTFRVAGLTDPAIVVPLGAQVTVQFINGDTDEAHGWLVVAERPPFSFGQPKAPSVSGAFSGVIGDPTAQGQGASTVTFQAGPAGTYQYICPMPGHAQMGMHGAFMVR
jgi:plastocyanin